MKLTVIHDQHGNIVRLVAGPTDSPSVRVELGPGERVTEVDEPDRDLHDTEAMAKHLDDLIANYRIAVPDGPPSTLERRG